MSTATPTMNQPYYPAEGGEATQKPGFAEGTILDQVQRDVSIFGKQAVGGVKGAWGFLKSGVEALGAVANADLAKSSDDLAKVFSPEGFIGQSVKAIGVGVAQVAIGIPMRLIAHTNVNGIPVVKQAVQLTGAAAGIANKLTFGVPGRLLNNTVGRIPLAKKTLNLTNRIVQGESYEYNKVAGYNAIEQTPWGINASITELNLALAESYRSKYASATRRDRPKILDEFKIALYNSYFPNGTSIANVLLSPKIQRQISNFTNYVRTGRRNSLAGMEKIVLELGAITSARKKINGYTGGSDLTKVKGKNGKYAQPYEHIRREYLDELKLKIRNSTDPVAKRKLQAELDAAKTMAMFGSF